MRTLALWLLPLGIAAVCSTASVSQPPRGGPPDGPRGGPPQWEPGRLLPPHIREQLDLTPEQQKKLAEMEKEAAKKLLDLLTDEQKKRLEEARQRRGPGRPPREGRPDNPPAERKDPQPERPAKEEDKKNAPGGIQWFSTWDSGLREAQATGRPILLVSAAPHCAGVSGIW